MAWWRMNVEQSKIGTEGEVGNMDGEQKRITAKIVEVPHVDPKKSRVRS